MTRVRKQRQYGANLLISGVLFASPWLLDYQSGVPAWNAWISAAVLGGLALIALLTFVEWEGWLELLTGLWVAVAPWVLGFTALRDAMWTHVLLGLVAAGIAALELRRAYQRPRATI